MEPRDYFSKISCSVNFPLHFRITQLVSFNYIIKIELKNWVPKIRGKLKLSKKLCKKMKNILADHWEWRFAFHWWILQTWKKIKPVVSAEQMILWVWNLLSTCVCYGITQGVGCHWEGKWDSLDLYVPWLYFVWWSLCDTSSIYTFHYYYSFIKSYVGVDSRSLSFRFVWQQFLNISGAWKKVVIDECTWTF